MTNLFLNAVPFLGIELMDKTWLTVAIVLIVIGEIAMGIYATITNESLDSMFFPSIALAFICAFWPCVLLILAGCLAVAVPLFGGYYVPKWFIKYIKYLKRKKREGVNKLMYKD